MQAAGSSKIKAGGMKMLFRKTVQNEETLASGLSWEADIVLNERTSRLLAWKVAACAGATACLMAVALILLIPLKQVIPYVVEIDKLTGESSIVGSARDYVSPSALNDKHWIKTFVLSRERYSYPLLQHDYDTVHLLAADAAWKTYAKLFEGDDAMDKKFGKKVEIIPTILSITLNQPGIATVRYELNRKNEVGEPQITRRVATLRYSFKQQLSKREFDVIDNPLGFSVDGYQTDPEFMSAPPAEQKGAK
jgi:type IV secretion system protein VirB8